MLSHDLLTNSKVSTDSLLARFLVHFYRPLDGKNYIVMNSWFPGSREGSGVPAGGLLSEPESDQFGLMYKYDLKGAVVRSPPTASYTPPLILSFFGPTLPSSYFSSFSSSPSASSFPPPVSRLSFCSALNTRPMHHVRSCKCPRMFFKIVFCFKTKNTVVHLVVCAAGTDSDKVLLWEGGRPGNKGAHAAVKSVFDGMKLQVTQEQKLEICTRIQKDCGWLSKLELMDYSLLVGVYSTPLAAISRRGASFPRVRCGDHLPYVAVHDGRLYAYYFGIIDFLYGTIPPAFDYTLQTHASARAHARTCKMPRVVARSAIHCTCTQYHPSHCLLIDAHV